MRSDRLDTLGRPILARYRIAAHAEKDSLGRTVCWAGGDSSIYAEIDGESTNFIRCSRPFAPTGT
jgi:hypothetical protein